jgi:hypothetical protein
MSPGYCPYDSCAVGGDWAAHPHAPGDASGGAAAGVVGGVGGGDSALLLPGDITASPASLGCGVVPPESCVSSIYSGQSVCQLYHMLGNMLGKAWAARGGTSLCM